MSIIGVDTGGTFTDLVGWIAGEWHRLKIPSTPDDPGRAVVEGVRRLLAKETRARVVHGSTVATNALLERTGARTALVTNRGFEDLLEIGRQARPTLYALEASRPAPLVSARDRVGLAGRIGPTGEVEEALSAAELEALPGRLSEAESVVVCLLHGYANQAEERHVAEALAGFDGALTLASVLVPEFREFERLSTAVVNGYVMPLMAGYLSALVAELGSDAVSVMGSGGGWLSVPRASAEPVRTVLSGPAGGVLGARHVAAEAGVERVLSLDMGGTSTDVALCPGEPLRTRELRVGGQPLAIDVLDVHTVGSGGGSVAWVDPAGALRVGPRSAGARPGPACYGLGGERATVTDANMALGRLPADAFGLEGKPLDPAAARRALEALGRDLGVDAEVAAQAIIDVADAAMEAALRLVSVERGYDPAEFTLVAFGGAAGLHAASLASRLGVPSVLVPRDPGILSAYGMVVAPARKDASRSVLWTHSQDTEVRVRRLLDELEEGTREALGRDGLDAADVVTRRWVDARYLGQSHELRVPADGWAERFHARHESAYGYRRDDPVQAVTLRAESTAELGVVREREALGASDGNGDEPARAHAAHANGHARVLWRGSQVAARVSPRTALSAGEASAGPAILTEYTSTTWIPPGWRAVVLPGLALELARTEDPSAPNSGRLGG
ncbi:MAG: hydantoinase/oxoprolinase family protein [Gemmatimonadota bacterium]